MQLRKTHSVLLVLAMALLCLTQAGWAADASKKKTFKVEQIDAEMKKLSQLGYHPFLMPLIMRNQDAIGLTKEQLRIFKEWRSENRVPLLHVMNTVLNKRIEFTKLALSPYTSEEVLLAKQREIFRLQRKVLKYQMSCRRNILDTFTEEQWDNFRFVLTESGYDVPEPE